MASSRQMRGRRLPSPELNTSTSVQARTTFKKEAQAEPAHGVAVDEWDEPPLRAPAPSFEDHKGLERHGVLEHMAPLGHLPGQKLKAKMKYQEAGPRRIAQVKNGEAKIMSEGGNTPEATPPVHSRRSEPIRSEAISVPSSSREGEDDGDYNPRSTIRGTPARPPVPIQPASNGTPVSDTAEQREKFDDVVRKAIKKAAETADKSLGLALQQLHEESFQNERIAKLLHDVLAQRQTQEQITEFQQYIKAAKKAIKRNTRPPSSAGAVPPSPGIKVNGRASFTRQGLTSNDTAAPEINNHPPSTPHHKTSKRQINAMATNGSPSKEEPPSKRIKRAGSASSSSSALSDLGSGVEDFAPETVSSTLVPIPNNHLPPQRTFSTGLKPASAGPRLGSFSRSKHSDPTQRPISTHTQHPIETAADEVYAAKRRKLVNEQNFSGYSVKESSIRPIPRDLRPSQTTPQSHVSAQRTPQQPQSRLRNGAAQRNRRYDDDDDALSSPPSSPGDLLIPPPVGASRGGTPVHLARHFKPGKKGPKGIKNSPLKKRNGVTAGVAPPADAGTTSFGYRRSDDNHDHENSDVCAACSGSGQLLCCDGCDRAFHFTCLQPPMNPETPPDGEWFCSKCLKARLEYSPKPRGVFMDLDTDVNVKNPSAFNLPPGVRDYFDGVKTGEEGEYEETNSAKAKKAHGGYEENSNNFKLRDGKENTILCFRCGKSAMGNREIAGCDFCSCSWHLDCLDPPLASAPNKKSTNGKPRHTWMCPNHIDDVLAHLDASLKKSTSTGYSLPPPTSRTYRVRRPKHAKIIDIGLRRGFKNNGLIEIESELSGEESEIEREMSGGIYRIPAKGLKLDFIDHMNRLNHQAAAAKKKVNRRSNATQTTPLPPVPQHIEIANLSFAERKAALNLAQLAQTDAALDTDKLKNLIQTLTAEAPIEVEDLMGVEKEDTATGGKEDTANGEKEAASGEEKDAAAAPILRPLDDEERKDLELLIELATRRLSGLS